MANNEYKMKRLETKINNLKKSQDNVNVDNLSDFNMDKSIDKILERYVDSKDNSDFNKRDYFRY